MLPAARIAFRVAVFALGVAASTLSAQNKVQVTVGTSPSGPAFTVDGTSYTTAQTFSWSIGSSHSLSVTSPQSSNGDTQYTYSKWSDSGAISHTVLTVPYTTSYTAHFTTSYELTIAASKSSSGSVSPATGNYYTSGTSVSLSATAASHYYFSDWTGSTDIANTGSSSTTITMNGPESIVANFKSSGVGIQLFTPVYVVETSADDAVGNASNCPLGGPFNGNGLNCTLRDALAAAAGGANVHFDPAVFASTNTSAQNTITLANGPLVLPSGAALSGLTVQSGKSLANLITIDGGGLSSVFWIAPNTTQVTLSNLTITDGLNTFGGAGLYNDGSVAVSNCTFSSGNAAGGQGGAIYNDSDGQLTLTDSTVSGNIADSGGGIVNYGTLLLSRDTLSGNTATSLGGGLYTAGPAVLNASTVASNRASAGQGGIAIAGNSALTLTNSIVASNTASTGAADIGGAYVDGGGNRVSDSAVNLAPLANYGGPTSTQLPLPPSSAICAALAANLIYSYAGDQRGFAASNAAYPGYSVSAPCVDAGAAQTSYSLAFATAPTPIAPATSILAATSFTAAVKLSENGANLTQPASVLLTLNGSGTLSGGVASTSGGVATYTALQIGSPGSGDVLMASVPLNAGLSPQPLTLSTASSAFAVTTLSTSTTASSLSAVFTGAAQALPLTASVTTASQTVNAGTITFTVLSGSTPVGTPVTSAALTNGTVSANYILPASAAPGTYTLSAAYNAAGGFTASSDTTHTLTVSKAATAVSLTSSLSNANLNASTVFTATVTGAATGVTPSGTVTFMESGQSLGSGTVNAQGVATFTTSSLSAGTHALTASYSGDADFAASASPQYTQLVTAPGYTLTVNHATLSIKAGQSAQVVFTLTTFGGFTGTINFACANTPPQASCTFSPSTLTATGTNGSQTSTLTIATSGATSGTVSASRPGTILGANLMLLPALWLTALLLRRRRTPAWLALAFLACLLPALSGCSSSATTTPPGSYALSITASPGSGASSGAGAQTVAFTLSVN